MEGEPLFDAVYEILRRLRPRRGPRQQYADAVILGHGLWAAMQGKPMRWACDPDHLPETLAKRGQHPSPPTLSRRLRSAEVLDLLEQYRRLYLTALVLLRSRVKVIDAMPLPVGFGSHDPAAKFGYGGGGKRRGYKLLAIIDAGTGLIEDHLVMPMNRDEARAARQLVERMGPASYLLGDTAFDKTHLYDLAGSRGVQLVAPSKASAKAPGHRRQHPRRARAKALLAGPVGRVLRRIRDRIERRFGNLTTVHLGLGPPPAWVRHLQRVGRWCQLKLAALALRRIEQQGLIAMVK